MGTSTRALGHLLAPLMCWAVVSASPDAGCGDAGCSAKDLAQDSLLLQSKYSVHAEVAPKKSSKGGNVMASVFHEHGEAGPWGGAEYDDYDGDVTEEWWFGGGAGDGDENEDPELKNDWMMEVTLDNDWIAGGDADDKDYHTMGAWERRKFVPAAHLKADEVLKEGGTEALAERQAFRIKFSTEHQVAVQALWGRPELRKGDQPRCERYEGAGEISGLYTFGAPGTALRPLTNPQREDGKFPGLRLVTQRVEKVRRWTRSYHDPVPFVAGLVGMKHPHMDLLVLPVDNHPTRDPVPVLHNASLSTSRVPRSDMAFWVRGHFQDIYFAQLEPVKDTFDIMAYEMLHLSKAVSPGVNNHSREGNIREAKKVGWNLVAQSVNTKSGRLDLIYQDNTSLYQNPETQACALSFVGTHHITQWLVNLRFRPSRYCGIPNVHCGFRNQVRRVVESEGWDRDMKPAMAACSELYLTGHSLGAGQAQLVAACLQRAPAEGQDGWDDYQHLAWTPTPETVRTLPAIL